MSSKSLEENGGAWGLLFIAIGWPLSIWLHGTATAYAWNSILVPVLEFSVINIWQALCLSLVIIHFTSSLTVLKMAIDQDKSSAVSGVMFDICHPLLYMLAIKIYVSLAGTALIGG